MVSAAADRYLSDKAPPICRVEVAKSFSQLTYVHLSYQTLGLLIVAQTQGETLCPLRWTSFMGRRSDHPRTMDTPGTHAL